MPALEDEVVLLPNSRLSSAEELALLKKEYENFSYVISHDLAAPLRHIQQFSSLLLSSLDGNLDERQASFAAYIESAVIRCQRMLDALLLLSRVDTETHVFEKLDLNSLIQQIVETRIQNEIDTDIALALSPIPPIVAEKSYLQTALFNLIDNAVKFRRINVPLEIKISSEISNGVVFVKIQDNGIGIEEKFYESIFTVFSTLGGDDPDKGIGAGLSLARKIISKHGGKIWCEKGDIDQAGVTFIVSLPMPE